MTIQSGLSHLDRRWGDGLASNLWHTAAVSQSHVPMCRARDLFRAGSKLMGAMLMAAGASVIYSQAHAQKLEARYSVSMTGIPVGKTAWTVNIGADVYSVSANGGAAGVLGILMTGEGIVETSGKIQNDRLVPTSYTSNVVEEGDKVDLRMTLHDGVATTVEVSGPPPGPDRVPIAEAHRRGVVDPLTALLISNAGAGEAPAPGGCDRTLAVFDGRRRYDLLLSFNRIDRVADKEYEGAVLVCNVVLRPIAGHRVNSTIMTYVAGRRDMEIVFAPIRGTRFLAPFRLSVPTLLGTMAIQATRFDSSAPVAPGSR
jgi:hypothetical protein